MHSQLLSRPVNRKPAPAILLGIWLIIFCGGISLAAGSETPTATDKTVTKPAPENAAGLPAKPVYPATLAGAKQAFKDTNYLATLKILTKLEDNYAGTVEYDYLLGRSALESKNFNTAIAAFIRVLTVDPDFAAARYELARAYYSKGVALLARGPFEQARTEFNIVSQMKPPPDIQQTIGQYQTNIDKYLAIRETEYNMFAEMTSGYDSNIASISEHYYFSYYDYATASQNTYRLNESTREKESGFAQAQAGIGIAMPLFSNNFELFGNLLAGGKSYWKQHEYDHSWHQIQFGARHYGENDVKSIKVRFRQTDLVNPHERYHEDNGVTLKWALKLNKTNALTFRIMGGDSSYDAHETHVYSVNYHRSSVQWTHLFAGNSKPSVQILLMGGRDDPQECDGNFFCPDAYTRNVEGVRLAWSANIASQARFYSSLFYQYSEYDREFFYQRRNDHRMEVFLGLSTTFGDGWYLRPEIHYINNDSTINLYSFERVVAAVTLGWGF